ncbi:tripartite tricarboxylate transporter substrate binding protein [Acidovorax sp. GBBC 1281]|nr:tripartite tricarboxylate transporter substrate binding protein [Acidovorax sp. GBBC 1281]WCM99497.1 tripartite tricarboxylate transporter substrate binding protein [Acidovorax sp. GBBC 1281]
MFNAPSSRRGFLQGAASLAACSMTVPSGAQNRFPWKPITLVVPFAPGGNVDIVARSLGVPLTKWVGQSVIVDNRAGGGGAVGTSTVARAEADGHTLLVATPGQLGTLPEIIKTPYKADSLVPVAVLSRTPVVVVVRANDPRFKTAADFIKAVKSTSQGVAVGHAGPGSPNHLALLQFEDSAQAQVNAVPYKGSGPALVDLMGGQIDAVIDQITSSTPHIKGGALRALMVLGPQAGGLLASVPTQAQLGLPVFDATTFVGVFAPKATPAANVASLHEWITKSVAQPEFTNVIRDLGSEPVGEGGAALQRLVSGEVALATRMVKQGRLKAD